MARHTRKTICRSLLTMATAIFAATTAAAITPPIVASAAPLDRTDSYLGTWNYDQPAGDTNVAVMNLFGTPVRIPQIGNITFERDAGGGVTGRTDQGCTWRFAVLPDRLELASRDQYCFNKIIGSGYNIDTWQVTMDGAGHMRESLHATSFNGGVEFSFGLTDGKRTKTGTESRAETMRRFEGRWTYDQPDPLKAVNILTASPITKTGTVTIAPGDDGTIVARTDNGCAWTLHADGNTAVLAPSVQHCGGETMTFWTIAAENEHQSSVMAGTDASGTPYVLNIGSLSRS
ncbi:hypothetical protein [Nocardia wallacei]|uniref:hypothetical protein n=1 Tax=Nocardia wallacei TaxID=480035 RepID=UPI002458A670|nr:hypothetical protein [Nocardia wallacei]